ncbi:HAD family hydrolase [Neptuniibacter caesariensis]|uniref:HAD-superfamily hydrolase subfamily IA n=1 Tax=Neptuniibacter caesariensis TaxID=207954 RepID=A0A7U8C374_NEPCE|nr:HAD-IA family hydrolase [Neptuniibacter caesariensis]EAR60660.1 HAD-superfamily hydrolase subfamily IA [Oceanospirillum sp. MED92] [Neptuniibacter caesariensis]
MYKLLIFDWDGTIIDSAARIVSSMQSAASDCGYEVPSDDAVRNIIGLGLPEALRILVPGITDDGITRMRQSYGHYYLGEDSTPSPLFTGAQRSLESMHQKGMRMAVATGKGRNGLNRAFAETGLAHLFETSRCADETTSKPDPHMLEELLQETRVKASEAVMIGDTEYDLEMGRRAGMDVIAVSYGAHHIDRLKGFDPVLEVHNFPELESWLEAQGAFG